MRPASAIRIAALVGLLLAAGCSSTGSGTGALSGRTRAFDPGLPDFDLEAEGVRAGIEVRIGVPRAVLDYFNFGGRYSARFDVVVRVSDPSGSRVGEIVRSDSLSTRDVQETRSYAQYLVYIEAPMASGDYEVEATLTDRSTGRKAERRQRVHIPVPSGTWVSDIYLESEAPIVSLHVPAADRPVVARVGLYGNRGAAASMHLVTYPTDLSTASAPHGISAPRGTVALRGVDHTAADTTRLEQGPISGDSRSWTLMLDRPGVYRLLVDVVFPDGSQVIRMRDLVVREASYPRVTLLTQMVEALAYLATPNEMTQIWSTVRPSDTRARFDAFWGRHIGDPTLASQTIARYYGRMEEANLYFPGLKDGWRTDRGMVYMVMGPPLYAQDQIDKTTWYYSYDENQEGRTFIFDRVRGMAGQDLVPHYVLRRSMTLEREWRLAVNRWLDGRGR